jgi:hypothetical protein
MSGVWLMASTASKLLATRLPRSFVIVSGSKTSLSGKSKVARQRHAKSISCGRLRRRGFGKLLVRPVDRSQSLSSAFRASFRDHAETAADRLSCPSGIPWHTNRLSARSTLIQVTASLNPRRKSSRTTRTTTTMGPTAVRASHTKHRTLEEPVRIQVQPSKIHSQPEVAYS